MSTQLAEIKEIIKICEMLVDETIKAGSLKSPVPTYEMYKDLIYSFCNKYNIKNHSSKLVRTAYSVINSYFWSGSSYTVSPKEASDILQINNFLKQSLFPDLYERIFISHCEKDKDSIHEFVQLLYVIGIPRPLMDEKRVIFCTSHPALYINNDCRIGDEIYNQFHSNVKTLYILWYSDNYFKSQACLNEMGAIWVMNKKYQEILMPDFKRENIGGLLNKEKINFYANDYNRLNNLKEEIEKMFELQPIATNEWEQNRNKFIGKINEIIEKKAKT